MRNLATILSAALFYAAHGWRVIPLHNPVSGLGCSCRRKRSCESVGKHPRIPEWPTKATTDESVIRKWWQKWPDANVGIATGWQSNLLVLDVDDKNDGEGSTTLARLEKAHGALPLTSVARSGCGRHYYFVLPGLKLPNRVGKVGAGLDIRAENGLIVAPPSLHATGSHYEWLTCDVPLAAAPQWLIERILNGNSASAPLEPGSPLIALTNQLPVIPEGQRNNTLFMVASSMRGKGFERSEIHTALTVMNESGCSPPLPEHEIRSISDSVDRFVPGKRPLTALPFAYKNPLHWMKVNYRDLFADPIVNSLKDYQFGWHRRLHYRAWENGGMLPTSITALAALAQPENLDVFRREMHVVLYDFEYTALPNGEEVLINHKLAELYAEQLKLYKQRCEASAMAAASKAEKKRKAEANEPL